jgi:hypothetical protein
MFILPFFEVYVGYAFLLKQKKNYSQITRYR